VRCLRKVYSLLPDAFTYNILIGALCKEGKISEACYTIGVMSNMGIMPDQITYQIVIRGFCFDGEIVRAKNLLWCMLSNLMVPKPLIWNLIMTCTGDIMILVMHFLQEIRCWILVFALMYLLIML